MASKSEAKVPEIVKAAGLLPRPEASNKKQVPVVLRTDIKDTAS